MRDIKSAHERPEYKSEHRNRHHGPVGRQTPTTVFIILGAGLLILSCGIIATNVWLWVLGLCVSATALSRGAGLDTPATELMVRHPITLSIEDNGAVAASVVREYRLKNLLIVNRRGKARDNSSAVSEPAA